MDFNQLAKIVQGGGPDVIVLLCAVVAGFLTGQLRRGADVHERDVRIEQQQRLIEQLQSQEDRRIGASERSIDLAERLAEDFETERAAWRREHDQDIANPLPPRRRRSRRQP